ncbi:MAG: RNA-binding protein [Nitriliruptorales bacterium]|nr:RNA-binding protein [Nitriliruptorales bacterium]
MKFDHYSDREAALAAGLVNSADDRDELRDVLTRNNISAIGDLSAEVMDQIQALRPRLGKIFRSEDPAEAATEINALLRETGALPQITDHDDEEWHLHYTPVEAPLVVRLAAEAAMGLAIVMRDDGLERLKTCASETCDDVFVDTSRNRSRRFCDPATCGNRANVAAFRARRRGAKSS